MICKQLNCKATLFCVLEIGIKNVNWKNKVHLKIIWTLYIISDLTSKLCSSPAHFLNPKSNSDTKTPKEGNFLWVLLGLQAHCVTGSSSALQ